MYEGLPFVDGYLKGEMKKSNYKQPYQELNSVPLAAHDGQFTMRVPAAKLLSFYLINVTQEEIYIVQKKPKLNQTLILI